MGKEYKVDGRAERWIPQKSSDRRFSKSNWTENRSKYRFVDLMGRIIYLMNNYNNVILIIIS